MCEGTSLAACMQLAMVSAVVWICATTDDSWLVEIDAHNSFDSVDVAGNPLPKRERRLLSLSRPDWLTARLQLIGFDGKIPDAATAANGLHFVGRRYRRQSCKVVGLACIQPGPLVNILLKCNQK